MANESRAKRALVIGASRGLGLGLVREYLTRGWEVLATVRSDAGESAVRRIGEDIGRMPTIARLEMNSVGQLATLREALTRTTLDVLFVNAGVSHDPGIVAEAMATEEFNRIMVTNALAPLRIVAALRELVVPGGTIAVMSSGLGSVSRNTDGRWEVYRASKAALNQMLRSFRARHAGEGRTYMLVAPGWVRTDMGGANALLDVETSVRGVIDTLEARTGRDELYYADYLNQDIPW